MSKTKSKIDPDVYSYLNSKKEKRYAYRHRYYDALGKRREKSKQGFLSEKEAYRSLLEVKTQLINGQTRQVEKSNITVSEWLDIWFDMYKDQWAVSSVNQRKNAIRYQMKPLLGHYKLAELDKPTYKRVYINELTKKYKASTVMLFHRLFKIAVNAAVDNEILPRNRFNKISLFDDEKNDNFLTAAELHQFLGFAKEHENITNYSLIRLLSYTGLRKGEALGLKWSNVDFDNKTITVERTRDRLGVRPPKTKKSHRSILIDDFTLRQLKVYRTWCKKTKLAFGLSFHEDDFIFISHQSGQEMGEQTVNYAVDRICRKSKIKAISPHGLRHTHATILIAARIPVQTIADRLGNTPDMIYNTYGHSFKELEKDSIAAFSEALNPQPL